MSNGYSPLEKKNATLTNLPNNIDYLPFHTTTGTWWEHVHAHDPNLVLDCLQKCDYEPHVDDYYDCEDRAFWGIAHVRAMWPGQPMAMAAGKAVGGKFDGENHAVIVFWSDDGNGGYIHHFFDPEERRTGCSAKVNGSGLNGDIVANFDTKILVPLPMYRPGSGTQKELPPFDQGFSYQSGAAVLDRSYTPFDNDSWDMMMDYLDKKEYDKKRPDGPEDPNLSNLFGDLWEKSVEDQVLWAFVHARRDFKGYAIGFASGTLTEEQKEHALLVLWDDKKVPNLVDLKGGFMEPPSFKVRTLIV